MTDYTRAQIEDALDRRKVRVNMVNGRQWDLRRNGATKTWKTRPSDFRIPVKAGLKSYGYIDQDNLNSGTFVIVD